MNYKFKVKTLIPVSLPGFDLADSGTLELGSISFTPSGELNETQLASVVPILTEAIKTAIGQDVEVEFSSIQS